MSEYQYYEFLAVDRPLGEHEMRDLRRLSSRATITTTTFVNTYNFGDFRGNPSLLVQKYFDAHLYISNWGTRQLMFRLPRRQVDLKAFSPYCPGEGATLTARGSHVVLEFHSETEDGEWMPGEGWLASLIPLRADLLRGDLRCLYLGWLLCSQYGELADDAPEPPVPAGLGRLTGSLAAFADFLDIDRKAIQAAAARGSSSPDVPVARRRNTGEKASAPPKAGGNRVGRKGARR